MVVKYVSWLEDYKEFNTESGTQARLDVSNNTKYEAKVEQGKMTAEEVAEKNHEDKLHYEFCILEEESSTYPECYVTVVPENEFIGVNFIDDAGRNYLSYHFEEVNDDRELFLGEAWYLHFSSETQSQEDYRLHFVFDQEGNVAIRKYDEINQKTEDYESNRRFDISGLYEKYPEFGQYESLVRLDRDLPFNIIPPPADPNKPDTGGPGNKWLPPGWQN